MTAGGRCSDGATWVAVLYWAAGGTELAGYGVCPGALRRPSTGRSGACSGRLVPNAVRSDIGGSPRTDSRDLSEDHERGGS